MTNVCNYVLYIYILYIIYYILKYFGLVRVHRVNPNLTRVFQVKNYPTRNMKTLTLIRTFLSGVYVGFRVVSDFATPRTINLTSCAIKMKDLNGVTGVLKFLIQLKVIFQVEDSGIQNGEHNACGSMPVRPYLCTGYDIYLVWEPCIM